MRVDTTPRDQWEESFRQVGFSAVSARSFAGMPGAALADPELPENPLGGTVRLEEYLKSLLDPPSYPH